MKKILIISAAVILVIAIAAGSFYGGIVYNRSQANQVQAEFFRSRGQGGNGQIPRPGGTPFPGGAMGFTGGGTTGQIKSIEGNTISLSTPRNETTVTISDSTKVLIPATGSISDLQPGVQVLVIGERDADGNVIASEITILANNPVQMTPGGTP